MGAFHRTGLTQASIGELLSWGLPPAALIGLELETQGLQTYMQARSIRSATLVTVELWATTARNGSCILTLLAEGRVSDTPAGL